MHHQPRGTLRHFVNNLHIRNPGITERQHNASATRLAISRTVRRNTLKLVRVTPSIHHAIVHTLEALAVDNGGTALVVFLLGDPHLLEGRERSQDGTTNPDGVLALRGSNNLDLHG